MRIDVFPIYTTAGGDALRGRTALVIDTLRMTSVAAAALSAGAYGVRAVSGVDEAKEVAARENALLGGERDALKIPGFDLSNSPLEYTPDIVSGRKIVMTTTNGAQAIAACEKASRVALGCLMNASACARFIAACGDTAIVLAGTKGRFSLEDAVTCGAILDRLGADFEADDMAIAALTLYRAAKSDLRAFLAPVPHVRRLVSLGYGRDVDYCLTEDRLSIVPLLTDDGWFTALPA